MGARKNGAREGGAQGRHAKGDCRLQTADGCRKVELVLLRAWHTKAVKGKSGKSSS